MIRDRIVVGIRNQSLSQKLQLDPALTLESAKQTVRQHEAVQKQQGQLRTGFEPEENLPVEAIGGQTGRPTGRGSRRNRPWRPPANTDARGPYPKSCSRCGRGPHPRQLCPAKDAVCHGCKKKGHFSSMCFSRSVNDVSAPSVNDIVPSVDETEGEYYDTAYLNVVEGEQNKSACLITVGNVTSDNSWHSTLHVNGKEITFKLDTGAEVSVITEETMNSLRISPQEQRNSQKRLFGADRKPLEVVCEFVACLTHNGQSAKQPLYVVKRLQNNLLGLPAIKALNLLTQVDGIQKSIPDQYPSLFSGLGTFKAPDYKIQLNPDAKPFALYTPRSVPLPLRKKVREELARMESLGVISRVEKPSSWCAGMVVVPKKSGSIRICVDFRPLNESVLREVHPFTKGG